MKTTLFSYLNEQFDLSYFIIYFLIALIRITLYELNKHLKFIQTINTYM